MGLRITYISRDGHYIIRTKDGYVQLNKYEIVILYIVAIKNQDVAFLQTNRDNYEGFTKKEIATDKLAWKSQEMISHPSERDFKSMVRNNTIQKCSTVVSDVTYAHKMFGLNLAGTRGNTVRQKPDMVVIDYVDVTNDFIRLHKFVTLVEDVMFVSCTTFLITMSHGIKFVTVEQILTHTAKQLAKY